MSKRRSAWLFVPILFVILVSGCSFKTAEELVGLAEEKNIPLQKEVDYPTRFETYGGNAFSSIDRQVLKDARNAYEEASAEVKLVKDKELSSDLHRRLESVKGTLEAAESYEAILMDATKLAASTDEIVELIHETDSQLAILSRLDDFKKRLEAGTKTSETLDGIMKEHYVTLYVEPANITLREALDSLNGVSDY